MIIIKPGAYLNKNLTGQATIEFSLAFILTLLFLVLVCRLFVWFNGNMLRRQWDYEESRALAGTSNATEVTLGSGVYGEPGKLNFHGTKLDILSTNIFK